MFHNLHFGDKNNIFENYIKILLSFGSFLLRETFQMEICPNLSSVLPSLSPLSYTQFETEKRSGPE